MQTNQNNQAVKNIEELPSEMQVVEKVQQQLAEYSEGELQGAGHQLEDLILLCLYNDIECL